MRTRSIENEPLQRIQLRLSDIQMRTMKIENQKVVTVPIYNDIENDPPVDSIEGQIALSRADLQVWWFSNQAWHTCTGCTLDGFTAASISEFYKYTNQGNPGFALCKGPDGKPWAVINESHDSLVGGGDFQGPFLYRWDGSSWVFVSCPATSDGGLGTEQTLGSYMDTKVTDYDPGTSLGSGSDPAVWGGVYSSTVHTGSYASASFGAGTNQQGNLAGAEAFIACDGTNIYSAWQHGYYHHAIHIAAGPTTFYAMTHWRLTWRVRMYNGSTWTELGTPPHTHYADGSNSEPVNHPVGSQIFALLADATGVYVFWQDCDQYISSSYKYYVSHWNGSSWVELGGGSISGMDGFQLFPSYLDIKLDGAGHPTIIVRGDVLGTAGPPYDSVTAFTFDGSAWHSDVFHITYPNFDLPVDDIPDNIYIIINNISMSPLRPTGDYVVGFQCNRDGYENYFATFKPSTRTWAAFHNGAKLNGTNSSSGQVVSFQLVAPEADRLWLVAQHYGSGTPTNGPHFWVYNLACKCWEQAYFVPGVSGPLTAQSSGWGSPYRDGGHLFVIENIIFATNVYHDHVWDGTIGHSLAPGTIMPVAGPPTNDNFANALTITGGSGHTAPIDINRATMEGGEPQGSCFSFGPIAQTVWFKWTAPNNNAVTFDTAASRDACLILPDTTLTVWTGSSLGSLTEVVCDDDSGPGLTSTVTFTPTSGTTYYIQVGVAYLGAACDHLILTWTGPPFQNITYRINGSSFGPYAFSSQIGGIQIGGLFDPINDHRIRNVKVGTTGFGSNDIFDAPLTSGTIVPPFDSVVDAADLSISSGSMLVQNATGDNAYGEKHFSASGSVYISFEVNFGADEVAGGNDGFYTPLIVLDDAFVEADAIYADLRSGAGTYLQWTSDIAPGWFDGPIAANTWYTVDLFYSV